MNKLFIIFFSIFCIGFFYQPDAIHFSMPIFITSMIIQLFSIYKIFSKDEIPYSLNKMFYLFSLFFFGIAPLLQFYNNAVVFSNRLLREDEYLSMNLLIIIIMVLYQLMYTFFTFRPLKSWQTKIVSSYSLPSSLSASQIIFIVVLALFSFTIVFWANGYSITSMLVRGGELKEATMDSSTASLIVFRFIQPLAMMCLLYFLSSRTKNYLVLSILTIIAIITCFPFGMARFAAAAMYIPLLLILVPVLRKKNIFSLTFIGGLLIVFPFLDSFRYFASENKINVGFNFEMFLGGAFDSYSNFALIVSEKMVTLGNQLLGVLFFWVPRTIWPDKPIGSGAFLADKLDLIFDNISANFFAEGYINFGYAGIVFFILLIAYFTARMDKLYWIVAVKHERNVFQMIYFVMMGMLFFMLRGDLLSSFAYTIGFLLSIIAVFRVGGVKISWKN